MKELRNYIDTFFTTDNPVYFAVIITVIVLLVLAAFFFYVYYPASKRYSRRIRRLKMENLKNLASLAESYPDPLMRVNSEGVVIFTNSLEHPLTDSEMIDTNIKDIVPLNNLDFSELITFNGYEEREVEHDNKVYNVILHGIKELNIAQIYFQDITRLKQYQEKLRILSNRLSSDIEDERRRLSRELHDSTGQTLALIKLKVDMLSKNYKESEKEEIVNLLFSAVKEIRTISHDLRPLLLEELGLRAAIEELCKRSGSRTGLRYRIDVRIGRFDPDFETCIYRIVQEGISNIIKHSGAEEFSIDLFEDKALVYLILSDDGVGIPEEKVYSSEGIGLINMKERIVPYGGEMIIDNNAGKGTNLLFSFNKEKIKDEEKDKAFTG